MIHDVLGHSGVSQTLTVVHQHFHWPGIKDDIALVIQTCDACQRVKANVPFSPPPERPTLYQPVGHVHVDCFACMIKRWLILPLAGGTLIVCLFLL
jgi:hypothetical protein